MTLTADSTLRDLFSQHSCDDYNILMSDPKGQFTNLESYRGTRFENYTIGDFAEMQRRGPIYKVRCGCGETLLGVGIDSTPEEG